MGVASGPGNISGEAGNYVIYGRLVRVNGAVGKPQAIRYN